MKAQLEAGLVLVLLRKAAWDSRNRRVFPCGHFSSKFKGSRLLTGGKILKSELQTRNKVVLMFKNSARVIMVDTKAGKILAGHNEDLLDQQSNRTL